MIVISFGVAVLWMPKGGAGMPGIGIAFSLMVRSCVE
jgi:hypothetical protein